MSLKPLAMLFMQDELEAYSDMRKNPSSVPILAIALIAIFLCASPIATASLGTQGYVNYHVTLAGPNAIKSFTVMESVSPTATSGLSLLTLTLTGVQQNLTYSRLLNSNTPLLFPYMIFAVNNQSISYHNQNYSVALSVKRSSSSSIMFNGSNYELTQYAFNASISAANLPSGDVSGNIDVFPSSLIYSAQAKFNGTTASFQLLSTNLQLDPAAPGMSQTEAITVSGVGVAIVAIAAFVGIKKLAQRSKPDASFSGSKPSYWVD